MCRVTSMASLLLLILVSVGCAHQKTHIKSSVVEYLYPKSEDTFVLPSVPHLKLPLKVGVAFVPEGRAGDNSWNIWSGRSAERRMTEANKTDLLVKISDNFRQLDFVSGIEVIPTAYLTPGGSFANLEQIKTMYGIDVIALVSYDQVQFTDEGFLSLSYWTVVGAYIVSGEKNDTNTLMDTVVYDISSKKMLFRAPGTSRVTGNSTPVKLSAELRADSIRGFDESAAKMVENLQSELVNFKQSIKNNPSAAKVTHREGYSGGGGAIGAIDLALFSLLLLFVGWRKYY